MRSSVSNLRSATKSGKKRIIRYSLKMSIKKEKCVQKTDEQLVKLTLKNQDWFFCIVRRYEGKLLGYIRRISGVGQQEAEDVLQDVFLKIYQNLNDFDPDLKFSSWIYRITHNQVISNYRKIKARPQSIFVDNENIFDGIASGLDLNREVNLRELRKVIRRALTRIDKKYREVLILKFLEEKDYQEISDILKRPSGTVAAQIKRGKEKLKKELLTQNLL
ncbi:MAG: RNA polymerase sigma factor SigW [Candidatus Portnoybacteria bacterium CG10_big_fil_rev_8_21_14_0_10_44_7]|uniref:RNA polymerase sigma factor n=1 Tax=Candidatus Portnoybacteria bacterium CG10_big_fil_rev_8_21_14_0_10_44_7 TaxID=1974816 RepID=A0A2M8KJI4_9BACT|nr:MAG: RNA polymerase sigma factor SigW [Candidatus Portnoybacteria bacterium CG10_big_fil_rev_8_21_14_0_10_44_7]